MDVKVEFLAFADSRSRRVYVCDFQGNKVCSSRSPSQLRSLAFTPSYMVLVGCGDDGSLFFLDIASNQDRVYRMKEDDFCCMFVDHEKMCLFAVTSRGRYLMLM